MFDKIKFYLRPLVCDNGGGCSFGRVAGWLVLGKALSVVQVVKDTSGSVSVTDIPQYLFYCFAVLLFYNLSKKSDVFVKLFHAYNGNDVKLAEIEANKYKKEEGEE